MNDELLDKPVTNKYLLDFTKQVIFPGVREIVREENANFKDQILASNDKLAAKLDRIIAEQAAHHASHERLQKRIDYLEAMVKVLAEDRGLKFQPPQI